MTSAKKKTELTLQRNGKGQLFSPVRSKWVFETPEERVRQEWLCVLVNEYGYQPEQMGEERDLTGRLAYQPRQHHAAGGRLRPGQGNPAAPDAVRQDFSGRLATPFTRAARLSG
ncbi:type I restriction enzyme HsdR N-terminal domain-containing protein [Polaromonas sp.]|uniref:type I restriction enzyme HsdR N-terminal domain-containing protein n=1 Tax=Polaromonas sp. TaxID=1869339 RepID=UPI003BB5F129